MLAWSLVMTSYWILFSGMLRLVVIVPGAVKAATRVSLSAVLENCSIPTVVPVPRVKLRAEAEGAWANSRPARIATSTGESESLEVRLVTRLEFDMQEWGII